MVVSGCMRWSVLVRRLQYGRDHCLGNLVAIDQSFACKTPQRAPPFELLHVKFEPVAWNHGSPELSIVDGHEIDERRLLERDMPDADGACGLGHRLDDEHARHDRMAGEMTLEVRFVHGHVL